MKESDIRKHTKVSSPSLAGVADNEPKNTPCVMTLIWIHDVSMYLTGG